MRNIDSDDYSMERRRDILKVLAEKESSEFIECNSLEKAAMMIERIFLQAKERVCILTDHLNADVFGSCNVIEAAHEFLRKENSHLAVIMQFNHKDRGILSSNTFLQHLEKLKDKISVYEAKDVLKSFKYHFVVAKSQRGNFSLMYEYDLVEHLTTGTFNGKAFQKIMTFFEKALRSENAEKIDDVFRLVKNNQPICSK